jgi:hypothetical protein
MTCQGRLIRQFPDSHVAVALEREVVDQPDSSLLDEFVNALCSLELASASHQDEKRGTACPVAITGLVMDTIAGFGRAVKPRCITKNSREHAAWETATTNKDQKVPRPLHRSATWLLLRVGLQLVLDRQVPSGVHQGLYKVVTTFHHARLLDQAVRAKSCCACVGPHP